MRRGRLTDDVESATLLDPSTRQVLRDYLDATADRLPGPAAAKAEIIAELDDGLVEATEAHIARGYAPQLAAQAAVAEFGDPDAVAAAFCPEIGASQARRVGLGLIVTGPFVGLLWLAALVPGVLPPWNRGLTGLGVAVGLVGPVVVVGIPCAVLAVAVTGRLSRWIGVRSTLPSSAAAAAGTAAGLVDLMLLSIVAVRVITGAGLLSRPLVIVAAVVGLGRLTVACRVVRLCLATRATTVARGRVTGF